MPLATYDLNAPNQMRDFNLFKHQFTPWKKIHQITADEVDYLLSILCKEEYAAMDCLVPTDVAHINDTGKLLYLESTLDDQMSCHIRVYKLEDIMKRTDETNDALVNHICQLACHALIGDGSNAAVEFEVQCRMIHAIWDSDIELWKEFLKVSHDEGVSHVLEISHTYCAIESGAPVMCASKTINAVQKSDQPLKHPQMQSSPLWSITNYRVHMVNVEGRGRRLTLQESTLKNHHVMRSSWMMFVHPIPMRHTQLFACLLLLATREWPHSGSRLTSRPVGMSHHCASSNASILITSTK